MRDWLAGFDAPRQAVPLAPETDRANRRRFRRSWVDVSYRSEMAATDALEAISGVTAPWYLRDGRSDLRGTDGRFVLRLSETRRQLPLGMVAVGRVSPEGTGCVVEAQMGRVGGDLPVFVVPASLVLAAVALVVQAVTGGPLPLFWLLVPPVLVIAFVAGRLVGQDPAEALHVLHSRVPPMRHQPLPMPRCRPDARAEAGELRRALIVALARPVRVDVVTSLPPNQVRDRVRALIRASGHKPVVVPWEQAVVRGRVSRRSIDVYVPASASTEQLSSPRLSGSIVEQPGGSRLVLRCGRAFGAAWGMLAFAVLALMAAFGCWIGAVVLGRSDLIGAGLVCALFGTGFFAAVVGTGWRAAEARDPVAVVAGAVDGIVVDPAGTVPPAPPSSAPLVGPYRR